MKIILKKWVKKLFLASLFLNYKLLIKSVVRDKLTLPTRYVDDVFQVFPNYTISDEFDKRLALPYEMVTNFNRNNINKPYEILEIVEVSKQRLKAINVEPARSYILPLCILDKSGGAECSSNIALSFGEKSIDLKLKYTNRFHYLPVDSEVDFDSIRVSSIDSNLAVGRPVLADRAKLPEKPKLVVQIFIDALTQCMIEKFGLEIMPNTKKLFSKGSTIFTNAYAQSEWTLSSMAGILTGEYTNDHLIYHPRRPDKIRGETIAGKLRAVGYTTFGCTNIPKLSPINGFDKGFDRYVLANDKDCNYLINEAIEQLDTFDGNQFLFLGFFDVHESHELQTISTQVSSRLEDFQFKPLTGNSKNTKVKYDHERVEVYKESIRYLDKKLSALYEAIDAYDSDAVIALHSDHGVNFMGETEELLSREREKVIFLYKNNEVQVNDHSIKEIRELSDMLCEDLNISDGSGKQRNTICITESLFPNRVYEIAVRNDVNVLFYKVSWADIVLKNTSTYIPIVSYALLNDETVSVDKKEVDPQLELLAKQHYLKLIENLGNHGVSI